MPPLSTPLCDRLGIDVPVVQAPIGSASCPALAAAVSNAGGLGTLAITWRDHGTTRDLIAETSELTDGPFAVNLVVDEAAQGFRRWTTSTSVSTPVRRCFILLRRRQ